MPAALKRSILIPLLACLSVLIALSAGAVAWLEHRHINDELSRRQKQITTDFQMVQEAIENNLRLLAPHLARNDLIRNGFINRDIKALGDEVDEFYEVLNPTMGLEHMDFIDTEGHMLYRGEEPDYHGSAKDRPIVARTLAQKTTQASLEVQPNGTYMQTVCWPWIEDGQLLGAILLSKPMEEDLLEVHVSQGVDCLVFMNKDQLTDAAWEESPLRTRDNDWERFGDHVLVAISERENLLPVADRIVRMGVDRLVQEKHITLPVGDQIFDLVTDPILNSQGEISGQAIIVFDTTLPRHEATVATMWVVGCSLLISLAVSLMFSARVNAIERNLEQANKAVEYEHQQRLLASSVADVLLETVPCGVFYKSPDGRYLRCNTAFATMMDIRPEMILGKTVHDILDAQQAGMFAMADKELLAKGQVQSFECQLMDRIGQLHDAYVAKSAVLDSDGQVTGIIGVMMDITARKQAEHAIAESMRFMQGALDALPVRLAVLDEAGVILATNERWHQWISTRESGEMHLREECNFLQACDRTDCLPIEASSAIAAGVRSVISGNQSQFHVECSLGSPEDEQWNVVRVVRFRGNGPVRMLIAFEDVTDYHQAMVSREQYAVELLMAKENMEARAQEMAERTRQLEAARMASENASRGKSQFLANMSHEVRTPLTPIIGYVDMLMQDELPAEQRRDCLQVIRRHAHDLLHILEDVMDIARIEAGRMDSERKDCSMAEILDQLLRTGQKTAQPQGISLEINIRQAFPATVRSDAGRLRQILTTLLDNAIHNTEQGKVTIEIGMDQDADAGSRLTSSMRIAVIDQGGGIPANQLDQVFEPFAHVQTGLKRTKHTAGLSLALSRRLARLLGGDIEVQSNPGHGSTFIFTFATGCYGQVQTISTTEQLHQAAAEYTERMSRPPEPLPTLTGTILLVEDSLDNQSLVAHQLREHGATVIVAGNGELAINIALTRDNRVDAVLMDMQMPVMDGLEATQRLRSKGYDRPIIALTAHSAGDHRDQCLSAGCNGFINKPVDVEQLVRTLAGLLNNLPPAAVA